MCKISNGVQTIVQSICPETVRQKWGLPIDKPLLIHVGRMSHEKNHVTLLQVLQLVPNAALVLLGDGDLRADLAAKAKELGVSDRVYMLGELENEEVFALLSASDVFVLPSIYEAAPLALLESASCGLPIVASDIPAVREILGDAGIFLPPRDAGAIADAVRRTLGCANLRRRMGAASRAQSGYFTVARMVTAYERIWASSRA